MNNFARRVLGFAARKLTAIHTRFEKEEAEKLKLAEENHWNQKFDGQLYLDYLLRDKLTIRLYKDSVLSKLIFDGFENEELDFVERFLTSGDTFFDIGANIGLFSLIASRKVSQSGKIFAFEPSPKTFARLIENFEINAIENKFVFNIGLSDKVDTLKLNISESGYDAWNSFAGSEDVKFNKVHDVDVNTLDNIVALYDIDNIDLIKLDVEGWEKFVLHGGEKTLKTFSPVIMVEFTESNTFSAGYQVQELYDILADWGYNWYRYVNKTMVVESKKASYPYDNLFAVKDIGVVNKRFFSSIDK